MLPRHHGSHPRDRQGKFLDASADEVEAYDSDPTDWMWALAQQLMTVGSTSLYDLDRTDFDTLCGYLAWLRRTDGGRHRGGGGRDVKVICGVPCRKADPNKVTWL